MSSFSLKFYSEPELEFGFGQKSVDPRKGLFLFGPISDRRKPTSMRVGVIGTPVGLAAYRDWVRQIGSYIQSPNLSSMHQFAFPGFEAIFKTTWSANPVIEITVSPLEITKKIRISDRHRAISETVALFSDSMRQKLREEEISVDLWFVIIPDEVYLYGRPLSKVPSSEKINIQQSMNSRLARQLQTQPSMFVEEMQEAELYLRGIDFHNQLKAELLLERVTTQIVRESTITPPGNAATGTKIRRLQDPATLAWNLSTAAFYKANGRPWKLANVREKVCYVGLVYKKTGDSPADENACCGAQMFLDSGDGLVFRGARGRWYSTAYNEFHLSRDAARRLMTTTVEGYVSECGQLPNEIFIHGQTYFNDDEWNGFLEAIPSGVRLIGVRIRRSTEMKLFHGSKHPPLRGTAFFMNDRKALLWTTGFVPFLDTYPGREVPNPLSVEIVRGEAELDQVVKDVMGLTKLNFNTCIFSDGMPVTLRFAGAVGEILSTVSKKDEVPPLPFRHYI